MEKNGILENSKTDLDTIDFDPPALLNNISFSQEKVRNVALSLSHFIPFYLGCSFERDNLR